MEMLTRRAICICLIFWCIGISAAQKVSGPVVSEAVYFDVSPPLREVVRTLHVTKFQKEAEKIFWNYFKPDQNPPSYFSEQPDTVLQRSSGVKEGDTIIRNFEGTANVNTGIPPDTHGDVGPNHYFHVVNLSFTIFDKNGNTLLGPVATAAIWSGMPYTYASGDAIVLYDEQADRWVISQLCLPNFPLGPNIMMLAVSQTPDPEGSWYRWEYSFDQIPDYPKISVWNDAYYFSCNLFTNVSNYMGIGAAALDRDAMLAGDPGARMILFKLLEIMQNTFVFSALPGDCDGIFPPAGTPGYFAYINRDSYLGIYEFSTNWANPPASSFGNLHQVNVSPFTMSNMKVVQKGSSIKLEPVSDRLMQRLQFRQFDDHQSMVVNHSIKVGNHYGIRWYELRRTYGNWSLYQQSTYTPDTNSRWMGSIAMDASGNIALGYSISGDSTYPSVRYSGRMKNDPLGQMTIPERRIIDGGGTQTHFSGNVSRWGDYSSMTVDPVVPSTFWYTQEYYPETSDIGWHTRIASFSFAGILNVNAGSSSTGICEGQSVQLDAEVSGGTGSYTYTWTSIPEGFTSSEKNPIVNPAFSSKYIVNVHSGGQMKQDTTEVDVNQSPWVSAGHDTAYCWYVQKILLQGKAGNNLSQKWTSSGDGTFTDPYALQTFYFPGPNDIRDSSVQLRLSVYPIPPCIMISDTEQIRFDTCLGIQDLHDEMFSFSIYPNPAEEKFTLRVTGVAGDNVSLTLYNADGRVVLSESLVAATRILLKTEDIRGLLKGVYILKVITRNYSMSKKIVVQ
jgi:hypothetical protein